MIKNDLIFIVELKARPQESFVFDTNNQLLYLASSGTTEPIPNYKTILVQHEASVLNSYGHSLVAKYYCPVTLKNGRFCFWVNFTEKYEMLLLGDNTKEVQQTKKSTRSPNNSKASTKAHLSLALWTSN